MSTAQPPQSDPAANQPLVSVSAPPSSSPETPAFPPGVPFQPAPPAYFIPPMPPAPPPARSRLSVLRRIPPRALLAGVSAVVALLSFFLLPFFEVFPDALQTVGLDTCAQGYPIGRTLEWSSGAQIAGISVFNPYNLSAPALLWVLPATAGVALLSALVLMSTRAAGGRARAGSALTVVSGIAGLASLVWLFVGLQAFIAADAPKNNFYDPSLPFPGVPASCFQTSYVYGVGFWLALVGTLGLIAASVPALSRLLGRLAAWLRSPAILAAIACAVVVGSFFIGPMIEQRLTEPAGLSSPVHVDFWQSGWQLTNWLDWPQRAKLMVLWILPLMAALTLLFGIGLEWARQRRPAARWPLSLALTICGAMGLLVLIWLAVGTESHVIPGFGGVPLGASGSTTLRFEIIFGSSFWFSLLTMAAITVTGAIGMRASFASSIASMPLPMPLPLPMPTGAWPAASIMPPGVPSTIPPTPSMPTMPAAGEPPVVARDGTPPV